MTRCSLILAAVLAACSNSAAPPPAGQAAPAAAAAPATATPPATPPVAAAPELPARPAAKRKANNAEPGHCPAADLSLQEDAVVASVDGQDIAAKDLGADYVTAEKKALAAYCTELNRLRVAAVNRAVDDMVLTAAAKVDGKDTNTFVNEKVMGAIKAPSDVEIAAYYAKFSQEGAPPLEQVKPQVLQAMNKERSEKAYAELVGGLKSKSQVQTMLPDVRPAALDVDIPDHAASFGPDDAVVELVEFSDFECPYCAKAATAVSEVKKRYGKKVKFAFRHFPLSFHKSARPAAEYAHCATEQDKFWAFHDEVFADQRNISTNLAETAKKSGLDEEKLKACLASDRPGKAIDADMKKAGEIGVEGTPAFYINGRPYQGGISADAIAAAIDAEIG